MNDPVSPELKEEIVQLIREQFYRSHPNGSDGAPEAAEQIITAWNRRADTPCDLDLDALEKVAREASHGPWVAIRDRRRMCPWRVEAEDGRAYVADIPQPTRDPYPIFEANAQHIAAFDPPTVLKLIAAVRNRRADTASGGRGEGISAVAESGGTASPKSDGLCKSEVKHADDCQSHIVDTRGRPDDCTCGAS